MLCKHILHHRVLGTVCDALQFSQWVYATLYTQQIFMKTFYFMHAFTTDLVKNYSSWYISLLFIYFQNAKQKPERKMFYNEEYP